MKVGIELAQGWKGEYAGWQPADAWERTIALAQQAEELGFESLWVADHFLPRTDPREQITFESFVVLAAVAAQTTTIRLGHLVACAGFRNPALTAKMAGTLDVISGGRYELGMGAGWMEAEWVAFGLSFPSLRERLAALEEQLEIVTLMLAAQGRGSYSGERHSIEGAINVPRGLQTPRVPLIVGGNGRTVTRRLAITFADELNLVLLTPQELAMELEQVRRDCEGARRDPSTLRVSLFADEQIHRLDDSERIATLAAYAEVRLDRLICFPCLWDVGPEAQERFAADCRAAGIPLAPASSVREDDVRASPPQ